ncbi:putative dehydrogenase [Fontibacillus phaseoli]|uniref:Putative dehydrogenase n=1 Tax=Fontibacillus phaseoli TaxID=1416533 RepID=A0A369BCD1_9BACL|nr:Gfo/Idh/MocA family oxidoreductase [Fontibacillus phaseoli]RCX17324.1 putative dehydrogenase [Fontibacillus phaseoli]
MKLGIAGYGRIVELLHYPMIRKLKEVELSAVFDVTLERRELAEKRGLQVYGDYDEFLENDFELLLIAAPPTYHYELAIKALKHGKHLIIEKPVTVNAAQAREIADLALRLNRVVTVFQNRRFDADFEFVKSVLNAGTLGNLKFIERSHHMPDLGIGFGIKSYHPEWRGKEKYGGGILLDWGVHLADQLVELRLGQVQEITSNMHRLSHETGDVEDYCHAVLKLDTGIVVMIDLNAASCASKPSWIIGGDRATLLIHENEAMLEQKGEAPKRVPIPPNSRFAGDRIYTSFIQEVAGRGTCAVTISEAVESMELLDGIKKFALKEEVMLYG